MKPRRPVEQFEFNAASAVLGWCGQPTAEVQCEDDGPVRLTGVEIEAYQPILLARTWDDPERQSSVGGTGRKVGCVQDCHLKSPRRCRIRHFTVPVKKLTPHRF